MGDSTDAQRQIGRLAFRVEGRMWVAYYALPDSMEGALLLGSISMGAVQAPQHKQAFIKLMQDVISRALINKVGSKPTWAVPEVLKQ